MLETRYQFKSVTQSNSGREILAQETVIDERYPGPLNGERWAGALACAEVLDPTPLSATIAVGRDVLPVVVDPYGKRK